MSVSANDSTSHRRAILRCFVYLPAALSGSLTICAALSIALGAQTTTTAPSSAPSTAPTAIAAPIPATAPATTPSTAPSTIPALDQSSPKALLRSFFASRGEVDDAIIRSLLHASNDVEQKVLDSVVQIELANARLRNAEREKFGKATTVPSVAGHLEPASLTEL